MCSSLTTLSTITFSIVQIHVTMLKRKPIPRQWNGATLDPQEYPHSRPLPMTAVNVTYFKNKRAFSLFIRRLGIELYHY